MDERTFGPVGNVVALSGTLALFLPSLEKAWDSQPDDHELRYRLRVGETLYLTTILGVAFAASLAAGNSAPFWAGVLMSGLVVGLYEHALRS